LTIKESTKEIKFNALITEADGMKTATADITLDRTDYNVRYGSGSFFDGLGDKTIYDEFDLSVSLVVK
jgi:polyisoprenoid-binding protein YceI